MTVIVDAGILAVAILSLLIAFFSMRRKDKADDKWAEKADIQAINKMLQDGFAAVNGRIDDLSERIDGLAELTGDLAQGNVPPGRRMRIGDEE